MRAGRHSLAFWGGVRWPAKDVQDAYVGRPDRLRKMLVAYRHLLFCSHFYFPAQLAGASTLN